MGNSKYETSGQSIYVISGGQWTLFLYIITAAPATFLAAPRRVACKHGMVLKTEFINVLSTIFFLKMIYYNNKKIMVELLDKWEKVF